MVKSGAALTARTGPEQEPALSSSKGRRIFLIRHAESEWNAAHRYTGQQDVPLSPLGRKQARLVAERLADEPLAAIYSSPLRRAHETAMAIAQARSLPIILDANLMELAHGLWEGLTAAQVAEKFAEGITQWHAQPAQVTMPQGESLGELAQRVQASLGRVTAEQRDRAFAICSHDAVLRVLTLCALDLGVEHFWKFCFENASLSVLEACDGTEGFRLAALNDTSHLGSARSDAREQAL